MIDISRLRIIIISPQRFLDLFSTGQKFEVVNGLPKDSRILGFSFDSNHYPPVLKVQVACSEYRSLLNGEEIPEQELLFKDIK